MQTNLSNIVDAYWRGHRDGYKKAQDESFKRWDRALTVIASLCMLTLLLINILT